MSKGLTYASSVTLTRFVKSGVEVSFLLHPPTRGRQLVSRGEIPGDAHAVAVDQSESE